MKVLIEALCAEYGGIRTHVDNLLTAWPGVARDDEVHVLVKHDSTIRIPATMTRHDAVVRGPDVVARPLAQTRHLSRLVAEVRPDVVLATLPSTTVRRLAVPLAVVVYDLRHELRPDQFSGPRRLLRRVSYGRGYAVSDGFIAISRRTLDDLHRLHPLTVSRPSVVAHLGADHVDSWPLGDASGPAVTFAHHANKNLDLVLDGWQVLQRRGACQRLLVLGVGASRRKTIESGLAARGLDGIVELAPFLPEPDFQRAFAASSLMVFASDFEGFGLPVVEAMRLGKPVVIGPEPAAQEVAGGHATEMAEWTPVALAGAVDRALAAEPSAAAREWAATFTWRRTVEQTRTLLSTVIASGTTPDR